MKFVKRLVFLMIIVFGVYYLLTDPEFFQREQTDLERKEMLLEKKHSKDKTDLNDVDDDLTNWMGKSSSDLTNTLGEPLRKDLSSYGYTWFVYLDEFTNYMLFGIEDDEIVTVSATGTDIELGNIEIGQQYDVLNEELAFSDEVQYRKGTSSFTFILNDEDLATQPLVKVDYNLFMQLYFDTVTETLTAIQLVKGDALLLHQAYELVYRGKLPTMQELSNDDWEEIERGQEQQVFELTNVIRHMYNQGDLSWEDEVSTVAFAHSKDMSNNDYFSHENLTGEGLTDRLSAHNILYQKAGENIAANYPHALATVVGWLNSEGHRESLLYDEFTHLGVGVYRLYYTQNFLRK